MRRVSVVGTSGSGKSTLARELAVILGVPHLELDSVNHQPGWVPLPREEFRRAVAAQVAGDSWVIDGNYGAVRPLVWARADTVIWLDLPKRTVMRQIVWRTFRRVAGRQELWNGNRERWRNFFTLDPQQSIIAWAWHKHAGDRRKYSAAMADPANAHLTFIHLTSRRDIARFLAMPSAFASLSGFAFTRGADLAASLPSSRRLVVSSAERAMTGVGANAVELPPVAWLPAVT